MEGTADSAIPAALRRDRILRLVRDREFVRVADLSNIFGTSEVTIRGDLAELADQGELQRVHGGAIVRDPSPRSELSFEEALGSSYPEKEAIGREAAALVASGDSIILDVGTTTTAIARALARREDLSNVVVFTSGINIALELEEAIPRFAVVVTGGTLRPLQHSLVDPMAGNILDEINATTAFIGCNGIHPSSGVTNVNLPEAAVKRRMIESAQRCVVVGDGSKVGNVSVVKVADLVAFDLVITGVSAPQAHVDEIRAQGIEMRIAGDGKERTEA